MSEIIDIPAKIPDKKPPTNNKINVGKALKLRYENNLSLQDIANYFGCSKQSVQQRLARFEDILAEKDEIDAYSERKADILSSVEWQLLQKLVDSGKLEKATLNNVAYSYQQVATQLRLEKGLSTSNVNVAQLDLKLDDLRKREEELRKQLGESGEDTSKKGGVVGNGADSTSTL